MSLSKAPYLRRSCALVILSLLFAVVLARDARAQQVDSSVARAEAPTRVGKHRQCASKNS